MLNDLSPPRGVTLKNACVLSHSVASVSATPWTVAHHEPLSKTLLGLIGLNRLNRTSMGQVTSLPQYQENRGHHLFRAFPKTKTKEKHEGKTINCRTDDDLLPGKAEASQTGKLGRVMGFSRQEIDMTEATSHT